MIKPVSEENKNVLPEDSIDLGDGNSFYVADNGNYFGIAFDKLFGQPQLNIYNTSIRKCDRYESNKILYFFQSIRNKNN